MQVSGDLKSRRGSRETWPSLREKKVEVTQRMGTCGGTLMVTIAATMRKTRITVMQLYSIKSESSSGSGP